jgi:hypothetical protein
MSAGVIPGLRAGLRFEYSPGVMVRPSPMRTVNQSNPWRLGPNVELFKNRQDRGADPDGDVTGEGQSSAEPQRRRPVVSTPLADDPQLTATLEEIDLALGAVTPAPYLAPPPLTARLVAPLSYGHWSPILEAKSDSFTADPLSDEHLEALDGGLLDERAEPEPFAAPPSLNEWLPGPTHASRRKKPLEPPVRKSSPPLNQWMVSATLILLVFAGAAASAVVFRERLSAIVVHWDFRLK